MARQATNKNLQKAKKSKSDEFYTQLCDIERELQHYTVASQIKLYTATVMTLKKAIFFDSSKTTLKS